MQFSDLTSPAFYADPYPYYHALREQAPLVRLAPRIWVTGRHAVADSLLRDRRMGRAYRHAIEARYGEERADARVFSSFERMLLMMNPPGHTRLRRLLAKAFDGTQENRFREYAQTVADRLVDGFVAQGAIDLVSAYATPLPLEVICILLDIPLADAGMLGEAVHAVVHTLELAPVSDIRLAAANAGIARMERYFHPVLQARRVRPGADLISCLLAAADGDDCLSDDEVMANIVLLFVAGHETTANMICNALVALHRHPALLAQVQAEGRFPPGAMAEFLRYDSSVQTASRVALEAFGIDGIKLAEGDMVFMFLGAANRDPERFPQPEQLLFDRPPQDNRFISLGAGIHHCLGARLAMVELDVALNTLVRRLPAMQLPHAETLRWHQRNTIRGVESLHAAWLTGSTGA